jgi:hypothetical protein
MPAWIELTRSKTILRKATRWTLTNEGVACTLFSRLLDNIASEIVQCWSFATIPEWHDAIVAALIANFVLHLFEYFATVHIERGQAAFCLHNVEALVRYFYVCKHVNIFFLFSSLSEEAHCPC